MLYGLFTLSRRRRLFAERRRTEREREGEKTVFFSGCFQFYSDAESEREKERWQCAYRPMLLLENVFC